MEAPKIPSFFRERKPIRFDFEPRYYNAKKEQMEKREKLLENSNKAITQEKFGSNLRANWQKENRQSKSNKKINVKILLYVITLSILTYFYFYFI